MSEFKLKSTGSSEHYAKDWTCKPCKAVLLIVHGLGEHCRRYDHLAAFYNKNEIAVLGYDHCGHGKTPGPVGHAKNMDVLMDGVDSMLKEAKQRYPGKPVFLYGHSMGGNISLNYVLRKRPTIAGAVITAPHIKTTEATPSFLVMLGRLLKNILPSSTQPNRLDLQMLSQDQAVIQDYADDPLVHDKLSYALGITLFDGANWLDQYSGGNTIPILLMHGGADGITSPKATSEFAKRVSTNITHKEWEGLYHEIHNEKEKQKVFNFTLDWINKRLAL